MKFSKSWILAISGMLVANSFLLIATTYAATDKEISVDPNHAEQTIDTVYFVEDEKWGVCSLVLFDISWSMKDFKCCIQSNCSKTNRIYYPDSWDSCKYKSGDRCCINESCTSQDIRFYPDDKPWKCKYSNTSIYKDFDNYRQKRNRAVSWAIKYSENLLAWNPTAKVWLILFWDNNKNSVRYGSNPPSWNTNYKICSGDYCIHETTKYTEKGCLDQETCIFWQKLSNDVLKKENFWNPLHGTYLDRWLVKAKSVFDDNKDVCSKKIIVILTDWVPSNKDAAINKAKSLTWVTIYALGYWIYGDWIDNLSNIAGWYFFNADETNVDNIFVKVSNERYNRISVENKKLKVNTQNFILRAYSGTESNTNEIVSNVGSTILWWIKNKITASDVSTIIAWLWNYTQFSQGWTILWWSSNWINGNYNTIMWWYHNIIWWNNTTIAWWQSNTINGNFSIIAWNNNTISGNNSLSMWIQSNIEWDNSFYWSDINHNDTLNESEVFAVVSDSGMAINTDTPHDLAQLTISWTLIVRENNKDINVQCGWGEWKWILKTIKKWAEKCLCSCDWERRRSLYNWSCESSCNPDIKPACWNVKLQHIDSTHMMYSWWCNTWNAIATSYYVTSNNIVNWACQTHDGTTIKCTWDILN